MRRSRQRRSPRRAIGAWSRSAIVVGAALVVIAGAAAATFVMAQPQASTPSPRAISTTRATASPTLPSHVSVTPSAAASSAMPAPPPAPEPPQRTEYPWHTGIVATTFWVGEIFDASAPDGSQRESTYDSHWFESYGGCDGVTIDGACETEARTAANGFFPRSMTPLENPFYLDVPFDDVNDDAAFARRAAVIPWANTASTQQLASRSFSLMKNRWVEITHNGNTCFGQIEDAGPGEYNDAEYVFGSDDRRPANERYNGAGMDVSPALNGCLGFSDINGDADRVSWRFCDEADVPEGPWLRIVTTSGVR